MRDLVRVKVRLAVGVITCSSKLGGPKATSWKGRSGPLKYRLPAIKAPKCDSFFTQQFSCRSDVLGDANGYVKIMFSV